jgi:exonuclease SbcC
MPYRGRQPALVLEGIGIACLAGENGAGKSSLLDAITWALWGRSRAGAAADPLVAAGAAETAVELEFRVGEGRYRVIRRHRKARATGRAGQTALEFQAWDGTAYRALSGANARETQQKVLETIRLDYETFINTAFLVQGKADLFVTKPPADRKRLLGEILGLSFYDRLAERARDESRERDARRRAAEMAGRGLERDLAVEEELQARLVTTVTALAGLRPRLEEAEGERDRSEAESSRLEHLEGERGRVQEETGRLEAEVSRLDARKRDLEQRTASAQAVLARKSEIEAGYKSLEAARAVLTAQGERARRMTLLTAGKAPLEAALREAKAGLEREAATLEAQLAALRRQSERADAIEREKAAAESRRQDLDAAWQEHTERAKQVPALAGEVEARRARVKRLREEDQEVQERLAALSEDVKSDGHCPLCGTELGAHGIEQVREHYQERQRQIAAEVGHITVEGKALQEKRRALEAQVQEDEERLRREMTSADDALGRLRAEAERAMLAAQEARPLEGRLAEARSRLHEEAYGQAERARLAELDAQIALLAYDPEAHTEASRQAAELARWEEEHRLLQQVTVTLPQDEAAARQAAEDAARVEGLLAEAAARLTELGEALQAQAEVRARLAEATARADDLRGQVRACEGQELELRVRLEEMERRKQERKRAQEEERRAAEEKSIYDELAAAFGVRGVQALLIETALPELEEEANALLARMTSNRMHLSLVTQRETKGGAQQETLELLIGDEWGTRAYEMYSGGETFRINFALRVALSKLLARRAGAEAPVLFIDEGFGSLDATGRDRMMEALAALWEDPAFHDGLILAITHIEEMKSQFDVRIEVTKTEQGSRFQVVS